MTDQSTQEVGQKSNLPVGKILASARTEQGMTTDMVAARLCLTESYIKALEAGNYDVLPGDTFIRGYLRNYADIVGLNGEELVRLYLDQQNLARQAAEIEKSEHERSSGSNKLMLGAVIVLVAIVVAVMFSMDQDSTAELDADADIVEQTQPQDSVEAISDEPSQPEDVDSDVSDEQGKMSERASTENGSRENTEQTVQTEETNLLESAAEQETTETLVLEVAETPVSEDVISTTKTLSFNFLGDCWYQVVDATGAKLAERTKSAGETSDIEGVPPFTVTLGDTTVVELTYEEELIDLSPYFARKSARFQVGE
jgi:cytoskeleton protein RodZ